VKERNQIIKTKKHKQKFFNETQNHKNSKITTWNKQNIEQKFKNKKPKILYERQNHKNSERTALNKQTKQRNFKNKKTKFSIKYQITKTLRELT
jgi:hypothetical protein